MATYKVKLVNDEGLNVPLEVLTWVRLHLFKMKLNLIPS